MEGNSQLKHQREDRLSGYPRLSQATLERCPFLLLILGVDDPGYTYRVSEPKEIISPLFTPIRYR